MKLQEVRLLQLVEMNDWSGQEIQRNADNTNRTQQYGFGLTSF